ncbi:MAG TPA: leucyl aminopeptidase, partial [Novosphingobium sp.]|nr:leucyl aminopeptidase [Novosphingobium sp.]
MQISFVPAASARLVVLPRGSAGWEADLDPVLVGAGQAQRFAGKGGQIAEAFLPAEAGVVRQALLGVGEESDAA